ncbi:MAG: lipoate--protein ligase family protein [Gemmatimonadetes bacterium]|nr:lipoate--protein ligase family protein [Gemmatimonadota bacterium]
MSWDLLVTPPLPGAINMAIDEALLARARETHRRTIRVYSWTRPTISLGRHQTAQGIWDLARCEARGVDVVRRLTGGRAILHHRELTYAVAAPVREDVGLRDDYRAIAALLARSLALLGIGATTAIPQSRMPIPAAAPCFELPARDELVVDGRKLVASAQLREEGAFLQHGSLLNHDDQGWLGELATIPMPTTPAATVHALLGRDLSAVEWSEAIAAAVPEVWQEVIVPVHVDACVPPDILDPLVARYRDPRWTWRR